MRPVWAKYRPQFLQRRTVMLRSTQVCKEKLLSLIHVSEPTRRYASIAIHRLKARGQQTEREQLRVAGLVRFVKMIIPQDLSAGLAPGLVYIQYQLKEVQDLLLVQRQLLRQ